MTSVIVSGHICADILPDTSDLSLAALSSPGKLFEVGELTIATGGAVSNTGLALHKLGVDVALMTTVGDDLLGRVIIATLRDIDDRFGDLIETRDNTASSYSVILSPENKDRIILHHTGNNTQFDVDDIHFDTIETAALFHLGYPPLLPRLYANDGEKLQVIYQRIYDSGVITSLDMAHPDPQGASGQADWASILGRVLPYVDIFLPSIAEITFMLRREDYDRWNGDVLTHISRDYLHDLAGELIDMGSQIVGFKLGEYGFYLRTTTLNNRFEQIGVSLDVWQQLDLYHPAFVVDVVGTTGAGDTAYAGFLAALLRGLSPQDTLRMTCAVGACNVEAPDTTSGIRSWDETMQRIEAGWQTSSQVI